MTSRFAPIRFILALLLLGAGFAAHANAVEKLDGRLRLLQRQAASGGGYRPADVDNTGPTPLVPIFIQISPGASRASLASRYPEIRFSGEHGRILTGRSPISSLGTLAADPDVIRAEAGTRQRPLLNVVKSSITTAGVYLGVVDAGFPSFGARDGSNVILGVVDSGVDFTHEDFITPGGTSRILFIWDQNDEAGSPGTFHPDGFSIGTEWTQAQINDEIDGIPAGVLRQTDSVGHGTSVLGVAGGDGSFTDGDVPSGTFVGMAPDADLIVVKTTLFNTDIADGVQYIVNKAASLGKRVVINLSVGSHSGPHDGTSSYETSIAAIASTVPVIVSMGNEAADSIHAATTISASGEETFQLQRTQSITSIDAEFWVPAGDLYTVTVSTALGGSGAVTASPGQDTTSSIGSDVIQITNLPGSHPSGDRQMLVQVDGIITASNFYIRLQRSANGATGRVDGWVSTFAGASWANFVESSRTISVPATANNVIAVGSYCVKRTWTADDNNNYIDDPNCTAGIVGDISKFSSLGPTRDGRVKPDITAPGERLATAHSKSNTGLSITFIQKDGKHRMISGTSFSAPVVAGAAVLALEGDTDMTVDQFKTIITSHARVDSKVAATGATPNNLWGSGKLRVFGCGDVIVSSASAIQSNVVGPSSISWTWSEIGGASNYNLYFADTLSLITNVSATDYLQTGLQPNTTVQLLVRGNNGCGEGPDGVSASTSTLSIVTSVASFGVFETSITANYTTLPAAPRASSSFGYRLDASTASDFSGTLITSGTPNNQNASLTVTGLLSFTTYYLRIGTLNEPGAVNFNLSGQQFTGTPLVAPGIAAFNNIGETQIQANWVLNGNPSGLQYIAHASTASDFSGTLLSSQTFNLNAVFTNLTPNTRYHFRARATEGPFVALNFEETLSVVPAITTPSFTTVDRTSFSVAWLGGLNHAGTQYRAQISPVSDFSVSVVSSETFNLNAAFAGLLGHTSYYLRVASLGIGGGVSAYNQVTASATLTGTPTAAAAPFSGSFASSVTVSWTPLPLAPADQSADGYRVDASTASDFTGDTFSAFTFNPSANSLAVAGLRQDTTYTFRVGALNHQNIPTYFVVGSTKTSGQIASSGTVSGGLPLTLNLIPSVAELTNVRLSIPSGTFPDGTNVSLIAINQPLSSAQSSQGKVTLLSTQIGIEIDANGSQPLKPVTVTFDYSPAQIPASVDLDTVVIGRLDGNLNLWTLIPTVHDPIEDKFIAQTDHFSTFAPLVITAPTTLDAIQIFPIPWKTGTGDSNYDAQFLNFTNLPLNGNLRMYTILGEFIWEKAVPSTGIVRWNGKNSLGHDVGSGTYLVVFTHSGHTEVRRVVVVR